MQPDKKSLDYSLFSMASVALLLVDLVWILVAAAISIFIYTSWLSSQSLDANFSHDFWSAAFVIAVLAPFILYDRRFGAMVSRRQSPSRTRSYVLRFALFGGGLLALGSLCQALNCFPYVWLSIWFSTALLLTLLTRVVLFRMVRRLQSRGMLTEVIAVVGAGPVADRLVQALRQTRPDSIELLGVFDDKIHGVADGTIKPSGTVEQLIELGKTRKIDWILLTLPPTAEWRVQSMVQRLKALSVMIGLCPQQVDLKVPYRNIHYVGGQVPVNMLAERPAMLWDTMLKSGQDFVPRWIMTLVSLPLLLTALVSNTIRQRVYDMSQKRAAKLTYQFDNYDLAQFTNVAAGFGQDRYGYVVTPNADHMIRLHEDALFRTLYAAASYILLDSRFLSHILRFTKGLHLPVCTGSDLTANLFNQVILPNDSVVMIGGSDEQARQVSARYGLCKLAHFNPPMGFIRDAAAVEECLNFIEAHSPFRFCFLAVGAPQQEALAQRLKIRGVARGLALCIGASINFLTGEEQRAPVWMQRSGLEWLFRLLQAPGRMAKRYLVRGPRVFSLLHHATIVLRQVPAAVTVPVLRLVPQQPQSEVAMPHNNRDIAEKTPGYFNAAI